MLQIVDGWGRRVISEFPPGTRTKYRTGAYGKVADLTERR